MHYQSFGALEPPGEIAGLRTGAAEPMKVRSTNKSEQGMPIGPTSLVEPLRCPVSHFVVPPFGWNTSYKRLQKATPYSPVLLSTTNSSRYLVHIGFIPKAFSMKIDGKSSSTASL